MARNARSRATRSAEGCGDHPRGNRNGPPVRQDSRFRRRPASRREVDAPPEEIRMLAVRSVPVTYVLGSRPPIGQGSWPGTDIRRGFHWIRSGGGGPSGPPRACHGSSTDGARRRPRLRRRGLVAPPPSSPSSAGSLPPPPCTGRRSPLLWRRPALLVAVGSTSVERSRVDARGWTPGEACERAARSRPAGDDVGSGRPRATQFG